MRLLCYERQQSARGFCRTFRSSIHGVDLPLCRRRSRRLDDIAHAERRSTDHSFYAKSYNANYPESFKVLYSTTGNDIDNFIEVESYSDVPDVWTEYTFPVPEGSVYFAIFCDSDNAFMFFVDDVTYTPANAESLNLTILGYNIYRNGEK